MKFIHNLTEKSIFFIMNINLAYEQFAEDNESPDISPSKCCSNPNYESIFKNEEKPFTIDDYSQIQKIFNRFQKSRSMEKFHTFIKWVESKKGFAPEQIYRNLKNFKPLFLETEIVINEENEITCMAISPNGRFLAIGAEAALINLWDLSLKSIVKRIGSYDELSSINCLLMTNEHLFSGRWDHKIKKYSLLNGEELEVFTGHTAAVLAMTLSRDESFLISSGEDNNIILRSLKGGENKTINNAHLSPINALLMTRHQGNIISASWDKTIKVWKFSDLSLLKTLEAHTDIIRCLALSPNERLLASGGDDKIIRVWDIEDYSLLTTFEGHVGCISGLKFSLDGGLILSGSFDHTVKTWNLFKNELKKSQNAHKDKITCILISPNGKSIITGSFDKTIKLTRLEKDYERHLLEGSRDEVIAINIFPNSDMGISGGKDKILRIWNIPKATMIRSFSNHTETITAVNVNALGTKFTSGDEGGTIIFWDAKNFQLIGTLKVFNEGVRFLRFNTLDDSLISCVANKSIKICNWASQQVVNSSDRFPDKISAFEIPNGTSLLVAHKGGLDILQLDIATLEVLTKFQGHKSEISLIKLAPNSKQLFSATLDGTINIWNFPTGELIKSFEIHHEIYSLEILNDNYTLITSIEDTRIRLWDWESQEQIGISDLNMGLVKVMVLSPDSSTLITTGGRSNTLKRIIVSKIKTKNIIEGHNKAITRIEISPNQEILAIASNDKTISLWEMKTWKFIGKLEGHRKTVTGICFTSDSKKLISGGKDYTIRLWDLEKKEQILMNKELGGGVASMKMFSNGERVWVACDDCSSFIVATTDLKIIFCTVLGNHIQSMVINDEGTKSYLCDDERSLFYCPTKKDEIICVERMWEAHQQSINSLSLNSKKNLLFSCGDDSLIKIWNVKNDKFELFHTLTGHQGSVNSLLMNSEKTILYSASDDKRIFMWELSNYKKIAVFDGHIGEISSLALTSDEKTLLSGSSDTTVRVWRRFDARDLNFLKGHPAHVKKIAISNDGDTLASLDKENRLIIWDLKSNKQKMVFPNSLGGSKKELKFTKDDSKVITGFSSGGKSVKMYDLKEMKEIGPLFDHKEVRNQMVFSCDESQLFVAFSDSKIRIWNFQKADFEETVLNEHYGGVNALTITRDGRTLISGGNDADIYLWDLQSYKLKNKLVGVEGFILVLVLNWDESILFCGGEETKIFIWDFRKYSLIKVLDGLQSSCRSLVLSPDNQKLFVGCTFLPPKKASLKKQKNIFVYSLNNYQLLPVFDQPILAIDSLIFSRDGKSLIVAGEDKKIKFFDYPSLNLYKVYDGFYNQSCTLMAQTISSDKRIMAFSGDDYLITVWDLKDNRKLAFLDGHDDQVNQLLITSKRMVISASSDKKIGLWSIENEKIPYYLQGHTSDVWTIALTPNESELLSGSSDFTIRLWDLISRMQIKKFDTNNETIWTLYIYQDQRKFLSGGSSKVLKSWNLDDDNEPPSTILMTNDKIQSIILSPDLKILIILLSSRKIQIWNNKNYTMMCEFNSLKFINLPIFLSNFNNRLILFYNQLIDCYTGKVIFEYNVPEKLLTCFYDLKNNQIVLLSVSYKLYQYDPTCFANYLYSTLSYDSILSLEQDSEIICNREMSAYPYFLSFLHLISIYEKMEYFDQKKIADIYKDCENPIITEFFSLDIFHNTPLDILIIKQNTTLIIKFFNLFFEYFKKPETNFFIKSRFLLYDFKENYSILNLFCQLITIIGEDLSLISDILDNSLIPFDPSIYDNSLVFVELEEPIIIEAESLYIDRLYIEDKLREYFKSEKEVEKEEINENTSSTFKEENKSMIKAKILCLPGICDIREEQADEFFSLLSDLESDNPIFANRVLAMMVNFIWSRLKAYYQIEFLIFFIFFFLFNLNFAFLRNIIVADEGDNAGYKAYLLITLIIDVLLFLYSLFCLVNELIQFRNSKYYFKSIWNYFDMALIPLLFGSATFDFAVNFYNFSDYIPYIKLCFSLCMFCFWFRFLSFFRSFKETSSMIRLILNVITGVKYFVLFMILFMLTLATTFYLLHNDMSDEVPSLWDTFIDFYQSAVGNTDGITSYDLVLPNLAQFFMITSTFLFAIISLNLLVSIIGDKHGEMKDNEEKTRVYELTNIIVDLNCSLVTRITMFFKPPVMGRYLVQLYNEKQEVKTEDKLLDMEGRLENSISAVKTFTNEKIESQIKMINEKFEKNTENITEQNKKIQTIIETIDEIKKSMDPKNYKSEEEKKEKKI